MIRLVLLLGLVQLVLLVWSALDVATTPRGDLRWPKPVWLLLLLVPIAGPVGWFVRERPDRARRSSRRPDDDDGFLRGLRRRPRG